MVQSIFSDDETLLLLHNECHMADEMMLDGANATKSQQSKAIDHFDSFSWFSFL